jgi:hypothetical protein
MRRQTGKKMSESSRIERRPVTAACPDAVDIPAHPIHSMLAGQDFIVFKD